MQKWYACVYVRRLYLQPKSFDLGVLGPARFIIIIGRGRGGLTADSAALISPDWVRPIPSSQAKPPAALSPRVFKTAGGTKKNVKKRFFCFICFFSLFS
jgi:hypothetical protein